LQAAFFIARSMLQLHIETRANIGVDRLGQLIYSASQPYWMARERSPLR